LQDFLILFISLSTQQNFGFGHVLQNFCNGFQSELFNYSLDFYCNFRGKWNNSKLFEQFIIIRVLISRITSLISRIISTNADKCRIEKQMRYVNNKIHRVQIRLVFSRVSSVHLLYSISRTIDAAGRKAYDVPHYSL